GSASFPVQVSAHLPSRETRALPEAGLCRSLGLPVLGARALRWRCGHRLDADAREVLFYAQEIVRSLHDLEQTIHRGNFLQLLGQEPLEKIDRNEVAF